MGNGLEYTYRELREITRMYRSTMMIRTMGHTYGNDCAHDNDINVGGGIREGSGPCSLSVDDADHKDRDKDEKKHKGEHKISGR